MILYELYWRDETGREYFIGTLPERRKDLERITEESVLQALESVLDPEIGIDIVNLGFIYDVKINGEKVDVAMTLTMRGCPMHSTLKDQAEQAIIQKAGAKSAEVRIVYDPPWNPNMMSQTAKEKLGFSPDMME